MAPDGPLRVRWCKSKPGTVERRSALNHQGATVWRRLKPPQWRARAAIEPAAAKRLEAAQCRPAAAGIDRAMAIEARAQIRLADEYDAAQERGEVQRHGGQGRDIPRFA